MRVVAAMSGGVDSAVAAGRMLDAGHEVVGVHLALSQSAATLRESARGCCTIEDAGDARRVADVLGIPFYVWDMAARLKRDVMEDFVAEYSAGRTPNPCLRCNEKIKFSALLDRAVALGFDAVATGHYAQVVERPYGVRELHRAVDADKDQSYVLGVLDADQLARAFFPLDATTNTVTIGTSDLLGVNAIRGDHARWCGTAPEGVVQVGAQVRAHGEEVPAQAWAAGDDVEVRL